MATHTQFHDESVASANASGDAIDEYLHTPALQEPGFAAAIATDAGYSQLRWITAQAIGNLGAAGHHAELGEVIGFMAEDKSNDWSEEISTLEGVERELITLRAEKEQLLGEVQTYRGTLGPLGDLETTSRYAQLGEFTAAILGANEEWDIAFPEYIAEHWASIGGTPAISDQSAEALIHWRAIADRLGIEHDALDEDDGDDEEELCAEEGCENSLDDGEGYDGYCGDHADEREAAGVYGDEDKDDHE